MLGALTPLAYLGLLIGAIGFFYWMYRMGVKRERAKWEIASAKRVAELHSTISDLHHDLNVVRETHHGELNRIKNHVTHGRIPDALAIIGVRLEKNR